MRNAWNPELVGLIVTIVTAILIRLVDHYFPNLVNEIRRVDRSGGDRSKVVKEGEQLPSSPAEPEPDPEPGPPGDLEDGG